jgi:GNAT superfamily N-acetyltransferase
VGTAYFDLRERPDLDFGRLTYAAFADWVRPPLPPSGLGIGFVGPDGRPGGLAVGRLGEGRGSLFSVFVAPAHRGRGHGRNLLRTAAEAARRAGVSRLVAEAPVAAEGVESGLPHALQREGWHFAGPKTLTVKIAPDTLARALRQRVGEASRWSLRPWTPGLHDPSWAPADLAPSRFAPRAPDGQPFSRSASFAVTDRGQVKGWIIAHPMSSSWLRVSSHYLSPEPGARRAAFSLWRRYFELVADQGWKTTTFGTTEDHSGMYEFCRRRAPGHAQWWGCSAPMAIDLDAGRA